MNNIDKQYTVEVDESIMEAAGNALVANIQRRRYRRFTLKNYNSVLLG